MNYIIKLVKALTSIDTGLFQKVRCRFYGKTQDLKVLNTYGISFSPPDDSFGISFMVNGYANELFVAVDRPDLRFTGLSKGEFKIGNYVEGSYVYFKSDGSIEIKPKTGQPLTIIGDVVVSGTITADNFINNAAPVVDFNTHIHTGDSGGDTGVPK